MDPENWIRIKALLEEALERPESERRDYVASAPDSDEIKSEVLQLLEQNLDDEFLVPPDQPNQPEQHDRGDETLQLRQVGDYLLLQEIGRGGSGRVFRAKSLGDESTVAVKVFRPAGGDHALQRFEREPLSIGKLQHPNIARLIDHGVHHGLPYIVTEYIDGPNLAECLRAARQRRDSPLLGPKATGHAKQIANYIATVAEAMAHAHDRGVIHRDLKPHNILLDERGEPHVVDFGLARDLDHDTITQSGDLEGTPNYMSPEQVRASRSRIDHRTDIYSLGVVLYELLTWRRPFDAPTMEQILHNITTLEPGSIRRDVADLPRDLDTICTVAMQKRPTDRYESAADFARDLRAFVGDQTIRARRPPIWRRVAKRLRRYPRRLVAAGLISAFGVGAWASSRTPDGAFVAFSIGDETLTTTGLEWSVQTLDPTTDGVGPARPMGRVEVGKHRLPLGRVRITVQARSGAHGEFVRWLRVPDKTYPVRIWLRSSEAATGDMQLIHGGDCETLWHPPLSGRGLKLRRVQSLPDFFIDRAPLTNRQYAGYLNQTGQTLDDPWIGERPEDWGQRPAVMLTIAQARRCAEFYGKRLPTCAEWSFAVRGPTPSRFPWGDEPNAGLLQQLNLGSPDISRDPEYRARSQDGSFEWYVEHIWPVGRTPAAAGGPNDLLDTFGNIWEWTDSCAIHLLDGALVATPTIRRLAGVPCTRDPTGDTRTDLRQIIHADLDSPDPRMGFRFVRTRLPLTESNTRIIR